jgi:hypothetical protein
MNYSIASIFLSIALITTASAAYAEPSKNVAPSEPEMGYYGEILGNSIPTITELTSVVEDSVVINSSKAEPEMGYYGEILGNSIPTIITSASVEDYLALSSSVLKPNNGI